MSTSPRLFEHLVTAAIERLTQASPGAIPQLTPLDSGDSHERIARHLMGEISLALRSVDGDKGELIERQADIANKLLVYLRDLVSTGNSEAQTLLQPPQMLLSLHQGEPPQRTDLPYTMSALLTRTHGDPAIGHELGREIATADQIDAIVSFVKLGGVRAIKGALEAHARAGKPFRLLTTTYMGATDAEALEQLARLPGVEIRISYDSRRTRLHAKAWLFSRASGLSTAYVGSANLSSSALFHGHEWMVKATAADLNNVVKRFEGTFETLWNDPEFEPFDLENDAHRERLRNALADERGGGRQRAFNDIPTFFNLSPYPFQAAILDRLEVERLLHGRIRNLVVAATGTGKTVVSAFDYFRQIGSDGLRPRLLFLAHREELLSQALRTFRQVLRDGDFGSMLGGGQEPSTYDHLFTTIQSFNSRKLLDRFGPTYWDHVILDEAHHAAAATYKAVIDHVKPKLLVGLTATPERHDGQSLLPDFDGHIAAELRLWHALDKQLLTPFEYYGISDATDLSGVEWSRGAYEVKALDKVYTGNDRRAELIFEQVRQRVGDPRRMRALGFCVSVAHAEFMAKKFTAFGVPSVAVHGDSPDEVRKVAPRQLQQGELSVIFTCNLYNEGVDLPFVDTLLLLRPTSSATVFLQQLGRGLRIHDKKDSCLVLDFIGQHRDEFRFDTVLSALTGVPRGGLTEAVKQGFPLLPSGCHVALDRVATEQILAGLQRSLRGGINRLAADARLLAQRLGADMSLGQYLEETGRELQEVYKSDICWSRVRRAADLERIPEGPEEREFGAKLKQMLHLDDPARLAFYQRWLSTGAGPASPVEQRWILMLAYQLFDQRGRFFTPESFGALLRHHPALMRDMGELIAVLMERVAIASEVPYLRPDWPLAAHRQYGRREILTAVGRWTETTKPDSREGVLRLNDDRTELLFVTLDKGEKRFSPTTSYEDYAISRDLFHWQTQSMVSPDSVAGKRYIDQTENGWRFLLFVRATVNDVFTYLGPVQYVHHTGSRPMSITWRLSTPIPGRWLQEYARLAS
ncbi:type I restriction enzyme EcoKI subunit R [compost metagenome]